MGKQRKRRNRRWSKAARLSQDFQYRSRKRCVDDVLSAEAWKENFSQYNKVIAEKERDLKSRSVFVTNIRDANFDRNVQEFRLFMESTYGPVIECKKTHFQGKQRRGMTTRYPPVRVTFQFAASAEKIFDGVELRNVKKSVPVFCSVGCKHGTVTVKPCRIYPDMMESALSGSVISINCMGLWLGQWFRGCDELLPLRANEEHECSEWIQATTNCPAPVMYVDLKKRDAALKLQQQIISFRFKQLDGPIDCYMENSELFLIFRLKHPPKLFRDCATEGFLQDRAVSWNDVCIEEFGRYLGYKLLVSQSTIDGLLYHENFEKLKSFGVIGKSLDHPVPVTTHEIRPELELQLCNDIRDLDEPRLQLLLHATLGKGKFCAFHIYSAKLNQLDERNLISRLHDCSLERAGTVLDNILNSHGTTKYPNILFRQLYEASPPAVDDRSVVAHCVNIPRLLLTPSRAVVTGFVIEMSNRVVRKFVVEENFSAEAFLRVHISDESGLDLFDTNLTGPIEERLMKLILCGIEIFGRRYEFLSFSSSQLKESSFWMVCPEHNWTVSRMRASLGDFSNCLSPSKYAARMGQCFSSTFQATPGTDALHYAGNETILHHKVNDDIWGDEEKTMCHSDGTGMIQRKTMEELLRRLPVSLADPSDVSIIQIRFGGAKGTLSAWDFEEIGVKAGVDICLRPSMIKFDAPYSHIEVCSVGKCVPYFLNRNMVLLLESRGVPAATFINLQRQMLDSLDDMMVRRDRALQVLPSLSGPDSEIRSILLHMLNAGFEPLEEPFLFDCLNCIRSHHLFSLRKKARIYVEKGAVLMGGIDETGLLPEGFVYCEIKNDDNSYSPLVGPVLVAKHPVMHPGDIRMLTAIDEPKLRGHRNCLLFSRNGFRPQADQMAGSDLDGDECAVCYDERLFLKTNVPAMDYQGPALDTPTPSNPLNNVNDIGFLAVAVQSFLGQTSSRTSFDPSNMNSEDLSTVLVRHLLNHIKLASVGQICARWLDYAAVNGAMCEECLQLAKLHSIAVDYPKSGIPATIPPELRFEKAHPHWRELKGRPSFHCEGAVGQLFDEVLRRTRSRAFRSIAENALAGRHIDKYGTILCNFTSLENGSPHAFDFSHQLHLDRAPDKFRDHIQHFAIFQREQYEEEYLQILGKFAIRSEGEASTGCIRKYHKLQKKRQHDFCEEIRRSVRKLRRKYRKAFFRKVLVLVAKERDAYVLDSVLELESPRNVDNEQFEDAEDDFNSDVGDSALFAEGEYDSDDEQEDDEQFIEWAERIVTARRAIVPDAENDELMELFPADWIRKWSRFLAAGYYDAVYSPELASWNSERRGLFSFPWIVIGDVISCLMVEWDA